MREKGVLFLGLVVLLTASFFRDAAAAGKKGFAELFTGELLRVDVIHSGNAAQEEISFRRVLREPVWGGPRRELSGPDDRGEYVLEMRDESSGTVLYRQGFSALFGEWRTTIDDTAPRKAFEETYELPCPRTEVEIRVARRGKGGEDVTVFEMRLDPGAGERSVAPRADSAEVLDLMINGEPHEKVDLVLLGDGYTDAEAEKFAGDCRRAIGELFAVEPFAGMRDRFNARAVRVASMESGVDEPRKGIFRDTVFGMSLNTFGIERYCMTEDVWAVHDAAALVPHDAILLMANTSRYGGGAVFNLYTAFASDNEYGDYLCVHEFGHGFAGLADEYFSSQVSYNEFYPRGVEPWEPNITALLDAPRVKWEDLIEAGTPIPTPFEDERYRGKTGVFEGAGYAAKGLYRPAADCKMFSKANRKFCAVCSRAVADTVRRLTSE
jgi:hypothetical protein